MGQVVSVEEFNNNDLTNLMIFKNLIIQRSNENVFRCVDSYNYMAKSSLSSGILNLGIHHMQLDAQTVNAKGLEYLSILPGHKFLNIGCKIGYFNTVVGLLLGPNGINHGIDMNQSYIDKAHQKLNEFKMNSTGIDYYDFCEPMFIYGNVMNLSPVCQYDRIYSPCSLPLIPYISVIIFKLLKIGGILVMVSDGHHIKITRVTEKRFKTDNFLSIEAETRLIKKLNPEEIKFPTVEQLNLQELCRLKIRLSLREYLLDSNPDLKIRSKCPINYSARKQSIADLIPDMLKLRVCSLLDVGFSLRKKFEEEFKDFRSLRRSAREQYRRSKLISSGFDFTKWNIFTKGFVDETAEGEELKYGGGPFSIKIDDPDKVYNEMMRSYIKENNKYNFVHKRQENEFSILMKNKINGLPIPEKIKRFLNCDLDQ
ncbi:protein-L-isoaspartate O-methyltransferase domain-containing protein 1-like [Adelges cooleyi]|uniref:protein-L-isoaspartate O-methyltransferase domain-containing protein 1-like n=1 Tax=Adelges cooleyi TaxID=133065 RepID=UPI00218066BF|nr:protein-L-isoaspartate O-methyltransferase domain-containing protein 1-like [Adelges cooleyi]XP_050426468.1 protein-L-isoaspartate O-methyltransferase domain-containing protein 1-like [Adelges cooleyi]XP_050426469.1 protein-L-isoaspartate O-methyltransferase domain-containing protein 1-like [Adelges cooleyi]